jgi:hypothetical protein
MILEKWQSVKCARYAKYYPILGRVCLCWCSLDISQLRRYTPHCPRRILRQLRWRGSDFTVESAMHMAQRQRINKPIQLGRQTWIFASSMQWWFGFSVETVLPKPASASRSWYCGDVFVGLSPVTRCLVRIRQSTTYHVLFANTPARAHPPRKHW